MLTNLVEDAGFSGSNEGPSARSARRFQHPWSLPELHPDTAMPPCLASQGEQTCCSPHNCILPCCTRHSDKISTLESQTQCCMQHEQVLGVIRLMQGCHGVPECSCLVWAISNITYSLGESSWIVINFAPDMFPWYLHREGSPARFELLCLVHAVMLHLPEIFIQPFLIECWEILMRLKLFQIERSPCRSLVAWSKRSLTAKPPEHRSG